MITQERIKELFHYCPDSGVFTRLLRASNAKAGSIASSTNVDGYLRASVDGSVYSLHRLTWFYTYGAFPKNHIDHINGIKNDNRIINLRDVSASKNTKNSPTRIDNTSGVIGVYWYKNLNKWAAEVSFDCKRHHLGLFKYKWDAICARKSAELKHEYHINHGRINLSGAIK